MSSLSMSSLIEAAEELEKNPGLEVDPLLEEDPYEVEDPEALEDVTTEPEPTTDPEPVDEDGTPPEDNPPEVSTATEGEHEYIFVSDATGRKKLKVDYSDKEGVKNAYRLAAGFHKMKTERDQYLTQNRELSKSAEELKTFKSTLDDIFEKKGIAGIYDAVLGASGVNWSDYVLQEAQRIHKYQTASPEEKKAMDDSMELQRLKAEQSQWVKQQEELRTRAEQEREAAEVAKFEAMVTPIFEKYRFNEIEDLAKADRMDAVLWREAKEELRKLEDEGKPVTQKVVAQVFKDISDTYRSLIGKTAENKAEQVIKQKKEAAQRKVGAATSTGQAQSSQLDQFSEDVAKMGAWAAFKKLTGKS